MDPTLNPWTQPYFDAGHDIESIFSPPSYQCSRCGAHQIDLSEDLVYGSMRLCNPRPELMNR